MKIDIDYIEDNIDFVDDVNCKSVIELMINAVRSYPLYNLNVIDDYLIEVKRIVKTNDLTVDNIKSYLDLNRNSKDENFIWITDSLSSLMDALSLMALYKLRYEDVLEKIKAINK
jgi:hypothetical protein